MAHKTLDLLNIDQIKKWYISNHGSITWNAVQSYYNYLASQMSTFLLTKTKPLI